MVEEKEVWTNPNECTVWVEVDNPYQPGMTMAKEIGPRENIQLSVRERRANQFIAARKEQDLFTNGTLAPVKLVDSADDFSELANEPNVKSETELKNLFKLSAAQFKKALAEINNLRVLERIQEIAEDDKTNTTLAQSKAIIASIEDMKPVNDSRSLGDHTVLSNINQIPLS